MNASVTRPAGIRIGGKGRMAPVAVVAETAREARAVAWALRARLPDAAFVPAALSGYLAAAAAPARVILCATRGPAARGLAFLAGASRRLLWPAPPADIGAAIGGLRDSGSAERRSHVSRSPLRRSQVSRSQVSRSQEPRSRPARLGRLRAALLLEGTVDAARTRAAFAAVAAMGPRDWIVESVRHVAMPVRRLAALERAGIRWSALEPVELLAVCAGASLVRTLRSQPWLPRGTPVWITPGRR